MRQNFQTLYNHLIILDLISMNANDTKFFVAGNLHQTEPVYFKADHPFLYFVIDSELDVTLMAGKVVNPLNSRIS